jgi:alpha-tubulin suppressor-like RCC1 family protein
LHACGFGSGDSVNHTTPVPVAGGLTFSSVSVGLAHTCGVAAAGKAYCWGFNAAGALGDGTQADTTIPAAVAGGIAFSSIAATGANTSLAETCGVTSSGVAYCWGPNDKGQIGDPSATLDDCTLGTALCALTPVLVSGGLRFAKIAVGTTADSPLPQIVSGVIAP